jgi:ribosomal protein S18 acetylase RimI-like enzyme
MIEYTDSLVGIEPRHVRGFFVGWPRQFSSEVHMRLLAGSDHVVLARDTETGQVAGFITAISDGVFNGFIPLLEVLPAYQGQGIGQALMRQMLDKLRDLPNVDLMCDPDIVSFYERFGMQRVGGMVLRQPDALRKLLSG